MAIQETVVNKIYRTLASIGMDGAKYWERVAFWTKASQVENDAGLRLEDTVGGVKGVVNTTTGAQITTQYGYIADAMIIKRMLYERNVILLSSGWVNDGTSKYHQTVLCDGVLVGENPVTALVAASTYPYPSAAETTGSAYVVNKTCLSDGYLTFYATSVPTVNLTYRVKGV